MKKLLSLLLALMMLLCTACGTKEVENTPNIYTDITGVAADETVMTVGEIEIPADMFFYWVNTIAKEAEAYYRQYSYYYGQYSYLLNTDGTLNWDAAYMQSMTVGDAIRAQAMEQLAFFVISEKLAKSYDLALTEAHYVEIGATIEKNLDTYTEKLIEEDAANEALTREEVEDKYFYNLGATRSTVERMMTITYLQQLLVEQMMTEGSPLFITEAGYNDIAFYADHILIATVDLTTGLSLSPDQLAEKQALAEDILRRLQSAEDPATVFGTMADMYSEDTGRKSYPTGYIFTPGTMVAEFEDAVAELEPGEISGLVKSTYGYHIILRRDLMEGLEKDYPEEKSKLAEEYLNTLIESIIVNSTVSTTDALNGIKLGEVYSAYMERTGQSVAKSNDVVISEK